MIRDEFDERHAYGNMTKQISILLLAATLCLTARAFVIAASACNHAYLASSSGADELTDANGGRQGEAANNNATAQSGAAPDTKSSAPLGVKDVAAVMPLTGETLQLYVNDIYYKGPTPNQTLSNFGVLGTDEGYPVQVGNQIIFFFGDTLGAYRARNGEFVRSTEDRGEDSIAYMPDQSLANCRYIPSLISQMNAGNHHPSPDISGCPILKFYINPSHSGSEPIFQPIIIKGLTGNEDTGPSETPVGTFNHNGYLYMFYSDVIQPSAIQHSNFHLETILTKSTKPIANLGPRNPPVFEKLYVASAHPPIADASAPPIEKDGPGKFIRPAPLVFSHNSLAANGMIGGLPQELQNAQQVVLLFGASWKNNSNLYLAAVDADKIDSGPGAWWYLANPKNAASGWSRDETAAQPLFSNWNLSENPSVGEHGAIWSGELRRFILLYSHHRAAPTGGIVARFSSLPWGAWSDEVSIMGTEDTAAKQIYHHEGVDPITSNNALWFGPKGKMPVHIDDKRQGPYGPYFTGLYNANKDGTVTYYFTMSPFVPYEVFLMQATFCPTTNCK